MDGKIFLVSMLIAGQLLAGCGPPESDLARTWTVAGIQTNAWSGLISDSESARRYLNSTLILDKDHRFDMGIEAGTWSVSGNEIHLMVSSFMGRSYQDEQVGTIKGHTGSYFLDLAIGGSIVYLNTLGVKMMGVSRPYPTSGKFH